MSSGSQSISDYFSYGCHCNLSGSGHGKAQDDIDSACSRNNGCRKCAQMDFNCSWNSAYFVNGWQQGSENGIVCGKYPKDVISRDPRPTQTWAENLKQKIDRARSRRNRDLNRAP